LDLKLTSPLQEQRQPVQCILFTPMIHQRMGSLSKFKFSGIKKIDF
jgi:hypothetical protein